MATKNKPDWKIDADEAEKPGTDDVIDRHFAVQMRRAAIIMIAAYNKRYGFAEVIIPGGDKVN